MNLYLSSLLILVAVCQITWARCYDPLEYDSQTSCPVVIHLETKGFIPRSCLDYLEHGVFEDGFYWLFDDQYKRYVAYCDLSSEPGAAWTLVMSWDVTVKDIPQFQSKAFMQDAPNNQNSPNWFSYRQTLARMKDLRSRSTHWRATCAFDNMRRTRNKKAHVDYKDYLRGKFSDFDVMTYVGRGKCLPVDYVSIRGHATGSGKTAQFWQIPDTYTLHIDSTASGCDFKPNAGAVPSEDNFGYYGQINSRNFRCTIQSGQTTNWWFGGYMA